MIIENRDKVSNHKQLSLFLYTDPVQNLKTP